MNSSYIVAGRRTPVAPRGGRYARLELQQLAAAAARAALEQCKIGVRCVDEVVMGNALGAGGNPARLALLAAGLPETVPGLTVDRQCSSGLDALVIADSMIRSGMAKVVLAGGAESYSRRPLRYRTFADGSQPRFYERPPFAPWVDRDLNLEHSANRLARRFQISRMRQDRWAMGSHRKALMAKNRLSAEMVTLSASEEACDDFTRNLNATTCARARCLHGSISYANTSVAADGAAFCVVVNREIAQGCAQAVRIIGTSTAAGPPDLPGLVPVRAILSLLSRFDVDREDLSAIEIMEAFAAQAIACMDVAGLPQSAVNLGGGSLARGHPIGASGAILAVRLFNEVSKRGGLGLAAIASAGGLGTAVLVES